MRKVEMRTITNSLYNTTPPVHDSDILHTELQSCLDHVQRRRQAAGQCAGARARDHVLQRPQRVIVDIARRPQRNLETLIGGKVAGHVRNIHRHCHRVRRVEAAQTVRAEGGGDRREQRRVLRRRRDTMTGVTRMCDETLPPHLHNSMENYCPNLT